MYLIVEDNPNCSGEERVFAENGPKKPVARVFLDKNGGPKWFDVIGLDEGGKETVAVAQKVDDSSDGTAWLIFGGQWGLRFRPTESPDKWDLQNKKQWGLPLIVLDTGGKEIEFK